MEVGLDLAHVAEKVAEGVAFAFEGLEGEGESGVGVLLEGFFGVVALLVEVVDDLFEGEFLVADFHLLGAHDAPGVGGELGDEEGLVGALGSEVLEEAGFEGFEVFGGFEREDGEFGGEAVLDGVESGFVFAFGGLRTGGLLRILLTCGALCFGDGAGHGLSLARRFWRVPSDGGSE